MLHFHSYTTFLPKSNIIFEDFLAFMHHDIKTGKVVGSETWYMFNLHARWKLSDTSIFLPIFPGETPLVPLMLEVRWSTEPV
jgi:hypothetical protein